MKYPCLLGLAALVAVSPSGAKAQSTVPLPPADLGQTNILDGDGGPGGLVEIILTGYGAERVNDAEGQSLPGDPDQRIGSLVVHPVYTAGEKVLGAYPGVEALLPISYVRNRFGPEASGSASGLGDVTIAPFLQWSGDRDDPLRLSVRAAIQIVAPTGKVRPDKPVNIGGGAWQVSPYMAVTKRLPDSWEMSGRLIWDRSGTAEIDDGEKEERRVRAGSFLAFNLAASRKVSTDVRVGLGGYALWQTARSRIDGAPAGRLQRVYAAGPVARWQIGKAALLFGAYREFGARERPSGVRLSLRLQHPL